MTAILGISAFFHDAAAALVIDGELVAAAQEERFSRRKHDERFPRQAAAYCLDAAGLTPDQIDYVGFYEKPLRTFERLLETYLAFAPAGYRSFRQAMPVWLRQKLHMPREIREGLSGWGGRVVFADHHESHAASAFFPSPFDEAAILTFDGVGEWSTACCGLGRGHRLELAQEMPFPHSLGLLYSAFTYYTGFRVNSGEYKMMGLAPYGEPVYRDLILSHLVDLREDGSFRMDMRYFNYCQGLTMTSPRFHTLFGGPPRRPESAITQRDRNLAASVQWVTEEILLRAARHVQRTTNLKNLVLAGGVALNCVANGRILRESPFDDIWVQPAAGDAGGALGVALLIWHQLLGRPRVAGGVDAQRGSLLGPAYSDDAIAAALDAAGIVYETLADDEDVCRRVAALVARSAVVGWFQGRMEFGPRALGARSILGDARHPDTQSVMNRKIKFRESFRPFAPIVLKEHADRWFAFPAGRESPYMMLVTPVRGGERSARQQAWDGATGFPIRPDSAIPAVTHVDGSARLQTVDQQRHPLLYRLLSRFHERTGCPVMVNTSFNVRGEPIVCTPADAVRAFRLTDMDALAIGRFLALKSAQPRVATAAERAEHLAGFVID